MLRYGGGWGFDGVFAKCEQSVHGSGAKFLLDASKVCTVPG